MAFVRSTILKSARRTPTTSLFAPFYKMPEKNWQGMPFISWPLYASNVCRRILGFVLLWCFVGEGTCFSLFSSGTAGSIFIFIRVPNWHCETDAVAQNCVSRSYLGEWKY